MINIEEVKNKFNEFVSKYDDSIEAINLKRLHTYRVAEHADRIADNLGLSEEDRALSVAIGYFHDLSRFEQWTQYNTFDDSRSVDHADRAVEVLNEYGYDFFNIDPKYHKVINFAVKNHNKLNISEDYEEFDSQEEIDKALIQSKIIRDADKIDILYLLIRKDIARLRVSKLTGLEVSEPVLEDLKAGRSVDIMKLRTYMDRIATYLGFFNDLNFPVSIEILKEMNFMERFYDMFSQIVDAEHLPVLHELMSITNEKNEIFNINDQQKNN